MAMDTSSMIGTGFWQYADQEEALASYHFQLHLGKHDQDCEMDALVFLHGVCGIFALALSDVFRYEIELSYEQPEDEDVGNNTPEWCLNNLVHIYCKKQVGDKTYYIDVRGVTDNWEAFYDTAFSDWELGGRMGISNPDCTDFVTEYMSKAEFDGLYKAAMNIILGHYKDYKV